MKLIAYLWRRWPSPFIPLHWRFCPALVTGSHHRSGPIPLHLPVPPATPLLHLLTGVLAREWGRPEKLLAPLLRPRPDPAPQLPMNPPCSQMDFARVGKRDQKVCGMTKTSHFEDVCRQHPRNITHPLHAPRQDEETLAYGRM
jgi:hypothetical protein